MSTLGDKFRHFTSMTYKKQGIAFLNAYWGEASKDAELVWTWVHQFIELDFQNKADGTDLDEFNAHRFLEKNQETKTVKELREQLKAIDLDFNKRMALIEYLLFRYKKGVADFVARPQGTNADLEKAQQALKEVQDEINRIENKKKELEAGAEAGGVKGMRSKNELEQLLSADQTELNRRTLTAEAAVRKAQKSGGSEAQGALWFIERELAEAQKYKPKRLQK